MSSFSWVIMHQCSHAFVVQTFTWWWCSRDPIQIFDHSVTTRVVLWRKAFNQNCSIDLWLNGILYYGRALFPTASSMNSALVLKQCAMYSVSSNITANVRSSPLEVYVNENWAIAKCFEVVYLSARHQKTSGMYYTKKRTNTLANELNYFLLQLS